VEFGGGRSAVGGRTAGRRGSDVAGESFPGRRDGNPCRRRETPWRRLDVAGARRPGRALRRSCCVAIPRLHVRLSRPGQRAPATPSPGPRDRLTWLRRAAGYPCPVTLALTGQRLPGYTRPRRRAPPSLLLQPAR
jgi:hypothetical protein